MLHVLSQVLFIAGCSTVELSAADLVGLYAPKDRMGLAQGLANASKSAAAALAPALGGLAYDLSPFVAFALAGGAALLVLASKSLQQVISFSKEPVEISA